MSTVTAFPPAPLEQSCATPSTLRAVWLGSMDYMAAYRLQHDLFVARQADAIPDTLLLLEHPHVITLGRIPNDADILVPRSTLEERGIGVAQVERGGGVTYHGPGQLVAYPIIRLAPPERDLHRIVWLLEEAVISTLAHYGVVGERASTQHDVWVDDAKICSIGLAIHRWIVTHGLAVNITTDLSYFDLINPCGHADTPMTSLARLLPHAADLTPQSAAPIFAHALAQHLQRTLVPTHVADL